MLVAPKDSTVGQVAIGPGVDLASAARRGRLAVGEVNSVPAGKYAKAALERLGGWSGVERKLAQAENVRAALALVARGEAPLGIVYRTDAAADPTVRIVGTFPADSHPPIIYPAAVTKDGDAAADFLVPERQRREGGVREAGLHPARDRPRPEPRVWGFTPDELTAIQLSLKVAFWATFGSLPLGLFVAYALARWQFPGKLLLDGLVHLPLVMPPVVTGYLLLLSFGRRGFIGAPLAEHLGIVFSFRWTGAALACAVMAFPLLVRAMRLSFEAVDSAARGGRGHAGRLAALGVRHGHAAAGPARGPGRHGPGLRQGAGRVRRHHHLRLQHPGRDPDPALGDLHLHPDPRRRVGAFRLNVVSIALAFAAMIASELLARPVARMVRGV